MIRNLEVEKWCIVLRCGYLPHDIPKSAIRRAIFMREPIFDEITKTPSWLEPALPDSVRYFGESILDEIADLLEAVYIHGALD